MIRYNVYPMRPNMVRSLLSLPIFLLLCGCGYTPFDHYARGRRYLDQKDYVHARLELALAISKKPSVDARYYFAIACLELKDYAVAARSLKLAEAAEGDHPGEHSVDMHLRLARIMLLDGNADGAIQQSNWVVQRDPKNKEAHELLGFALAKMAQPERSAGELEQTLLADPSNMQARVLLASIKLAARDLTDAESQLKTAVENTKRSPTSLIVLANFYQLTGHPEQAEPLLDEAVRANPQSVELRIGQGRFYMRAGQPEKAESAFQAAAKLNPTDPEQRGALATFYLSRGDIPKAVAALEAIAQAAPQGQTAAERARLGGAYYLAGRYEDSRKIAAQLLQENDKNLQAHMLNGLVKSATGQNQEALTEFNHLLHFMPDSASVHYFAGLCYQRARNDELARQSMQEALRLDSRLRPARFWISDDLLRSGNFDGAWETLRQAPAEQGDDPLLRLRLASIEQATHKDPAACADVTAALATSAAWIPEFYGAGFSSVLDKCPAATGPALEKELQKQPASARLLTSLAHLIGVVKSRDLAFARVQMQISHNPELAHSVPHILLVANLANGLGQHMAAFQFLKRAVDLDPDSPDPILAMAQVEISSHDLESAKKHCEELTERWPKSPWGWLWLGSIREVQGDLPGASQAFEQALTVDPRNSVAANNLAWRLASDNGDLARAELLARRALERDPANVGYADTLGFVEYKENQLKPAREILDDAARRDPRNSGILYHLALVKKDSGDLPGAMNDLKHALALNAQFPEVAKASALMDEIKSQLTR